MEFAIATSLVLMDSFGDLMTEPVLLPANVQERLIISKMVFVFVKFHA
jgi:hypothetical protein